jgi:hypothetical protein
LRQLEDVGWAEQFRRRNIPTVIPRHYEFDFDLRKGLIQSYKYLVSHIQTGVEVSFQNMSARQMFMSPEKGGSVFSGALLRALASVQRAKFHLLLFTVCFYTRRPGIWY